jgi:hypothetical protein
MSLIKGATIFRLHLRGDRVLVQRIVGELSYLLSTLRRTTPWKLTIEEKELA